MKKFSGSILKLMCVCGVILGNMALYAETGAEPAKPTQKKSDAVNSFFSKIKENAVTFFANDPSVSVLVQALKAADMYSVLQSKEPFTIFAPNNAAFGKLPPGTLKDLMKLENKEKLMAVLKNHVVSEKLDTADLKPMKLKAASGKELDITVQGADMYVNGAKVLKTETVGTNGVIYIIDAVLLPQ